MNLVIFDIDGTLTDTTQVDEHAIVGALQDVLGVTDLSTDWSDYEHSTDSGIVNEVIVRSHGTTPPTILQNVQARFFEYMEGFYTASPDLFRPMNGAEDILRRVTSKGDAAAIATGSWRESALFKLRVARIWHDGIPMATADDSLSRSGIIKKAIKDAVDVYHVEAFDSITYVGDGVWDARAGKNLGLRFIGLASNGTAERLRKVGVEEICASLEEVADKLGV